MPAQINVPGYLIWIRGKPVEFADKIWFNKSVYILIRKLCDLKGTTEQQIQHLNVRNWIHIKELLRRVWTSFRIIALFTTHHIVLLANDLWKCWAQQRANSNHTTANAIQHYKSHIYICVCISALSFNWQQIFGVHRRYDRNIALDFMHNSFWLRKMVFIATPHRIQRLNGYLGMQRVNILPEPCIFICKTRRECLAVRRDAKIIHQNNNTVCVCFLSSNQHLCSGFSENWIIFPKYFLRREATRASPVL